MKKSNLMILTFIGLILLFVMLYVNFLAAYLPLNGKSTGDLSDQYPNLFVPAGLTFSIWGVIYIALIGFTIFYIIKAIKEPEFVNKTLNILIAFFVTCLLNILWIFAWHYMKIIFSMIIMLLFLITLIYIFQSQRKLLKNEKLSPIFTIPIGIYLGWISVATIANFTALLVHFNWNGFGISQQIWTIIMIIIGGAISILMLFKNNSIAYSLVTIWAFIGIIIKRISSTPVYKEIIISAIVMIFLILIALIRSIVILVKQRR